MNVHASKVDWWLGAVLIGSAVLVGLVVLRMLVASAPGRPFAALLLLAVGCVLPLWVLVGTRYTIAPPLLVVRSGPFLWKIPLAEIKKITPTRNPLSSPALSLDRLRIEYGSGKVCMISPRAQEGFLRELRKAGASIL